MLDKGSIIPGTILESGIKFDSFGRFVGTAFSNNRTCTVLSADEISKSFFCFEALAKEKCAVMECNVLSQADFI